MQEKNAIKSCAFGKTNKAPIQRFNVKCLASVERNITTKKHRYMFEFFLYIFEKTHK